MSRQHVDFTTSANSPPNAPADDGLDTGETNNAAVRPINDGEPAQGAVFKRPSENLRTRSEITRDELEKLKYLSDADRALLLTSVSSVTWAGIGGPGTFSLTGGPQTMVLKPFMAPDVSSASRLKICANTASQITIRTRQNGVSGQPRAYNGANKISFDFQPVDTGTGAVIITVTGSPADNFHVQFDSNAISGTTVQQMLNYLNNAIVTPGGAAFVAAGLEAVVDGTGTPTEVGFPTPPAPIVANKVYLTLTVPEQATRYMSGAADAEKHHITQTHLTSFFTPDNYLLEGDVICVRYDDQVMPLDGGRRQSINEAPENKAAVAGANLFLMRRFPERLPGALPLCAVVNGTLIFVNGRSFLAGETGPLVAAGASYQGSNASPNSWADLTVVAGPISFETALDTIIQTLGTKSGGSPGAIKVGFTPSGNIAANTVKGALEELDSEKASLALPNNTFTNANVFSPSTAATTAITATGNTTGRGVVGTGGATDAAGGYFTGGGANGRGVEGYGKGTGGHGGLFYAEGIAIAAVPGGEGVRGTGGTNTGAGAATGGYGVVGQGGDALLMGNAGAGVVGLGGANGGNGVVGQAYGTGAGVAGASGGGVNATGGIFTSYAGTTGPGVFAQGSGTGPGIRGQGGASSNSYGGDFATTAVNGNGLVAYGAGEGVAVEARGGTNNTNGAGPTIGLSPVGGPGNGATIFGAAGTQGGDGLQVFARGTATPRTGIYAVGSYTTALNQNGGAGGYMIGGEGSNGVAPGGTGSVHIGAAGFGGGTGGNGLNAQGGNPGGHGIYAEGSTVGAGVFSRGGGTAPVSFATRKNGAGLVGEGGVGSSANGVVGRGASGLTEGVSALNFSNCGGVFVGTGGGSGVEGISSATNGAYGVSGYGSTGVNGNGVHGVATGTGVGVRGDGATGAAGHGIYGVSGSTGGYGVYGQALTNGWDGVWGQGKGNGSGVVGRGDQGALGTTSYDVRGVSGLGGSGSNSAGTSRGGGGVIGLGGDSFLVPSIGGDYYRGYGGPGLQGQGGAGRFGGDGVVGTGGDASGNGIDGAGAGGNGGRFVGASADGSSPQLAGVGHGAFGTGGNGTNQAGGHGFVGNGGTSDVSFPGYAFYAATGHIKLAGGNPAYNANVGKNVIAASSTIKAWAFCVNNLGIGSITTGFNVSALTWDAVNSEYYLSLINPVSAFACVVAMDEVGAYFISQATLNHTVAVAFHSTIGGARVNMAAVGVHRWSMIVLGVSP